MPVAVFAVSMLVMLMAAAPSAASPSCMSRTEARRHFGSAHLYWHGRNHCWNALQPQRHDRIAGVPRSVVPPKWREPMAEMLPDNEPVQKPLQMAAQTPLPDRQANIEPPQSPVAERWVDIVQVTSPPVIEREPEPKPEAKVTPRSALLAFIAIVLMLGTIEVLFRCTSDERRPSGRDTPSAG
jgi:hypothetical protein